VPYESLTKDRITRALRRLGELAQADGVSLEISLYGGAVFALVYESRTSTKDVDALIHPSDIARKLAKRVAAEQDLPDDWINDNVRFFLSNKEAKRRLQGDEFGPAIRISVPTAAYLLSLKLHACRPPLPGYAGDYDDLRFLLRKMGLSTFAEVEKIHDRFFPHDVLPDVTREVVSGMLKEIRHS